MRELAQQIYAAVGAGRLAEPFTPDTVRRACPGWAVHTYGVFLPKHRVGNPSRTTELFVQVAPGSYRLNKSN
jgi:hypothetical protein